MTPNARDCLWALLCLVVLTGAITAIGYEVGLYRIWAFWKGAA